MIGANERWIYLGMPKLHFTNQPFAGRVYDLVVDKTTVGRGEHNTLVITDDSVSVNHCEILVHGDEVIIRERGSSNGTFLDGVRIEGQMPVHNGQVIRFGTVEARVEVERAASAESGTDHTAIYEYDQVLRDQQTERQKTTTAHTRLEPGPSSKAKVEQRAPLPMTTPAQAPEFSPSRGKKPGSSKWYLAVAVIALIVVVVIWLVRR